MQDPNDPYPAYPEDADVPQGTSLIPFRMEASEKLREQGNALFKQVGLLHELHAVLHTIRDHSHLHPPCVLLAACRTSGWHCHADASLDKSDPIRLGHKSRTSG